MSFLYNFVNNVFSDVWTTIFSLFFGFIIYKVILMYIKVWSLPPGPFPLPLIGNLLELRAPVHWTGVLRKCAKIYGPVFTFWFGNRPNIFIADIDLAREAFKKSEFCGRPVGLMKKYFSNEKHQDIAFTDCGHIFHTLRGVTYSAVQKYSKSDKIVNLVNDCVEQTVKDMIANEGINKEFSPIQYNHLLFLNIGTTLAFSVRSSKEDVVYRKIKAFITDISKEVGGRFVLWEFSSLLRLLDWKLIKRYDKAVNDLNNTVESLYKNHEKNYNESNERDICDALISAKNIALREGKQSAHILTDKNLAMCMADLIIAATETSSTAMSWAILFMTNKPEFQNKLREEIEREIGDRIPTHEDRNRCHYVMAFLSETLRVRNIIPSGLPHTTLTDTNLESYTLPKGTGVMVLQQIISTDDKHFPNGEEFKPKRFLEKGQFVAFISKANIPFGVGRRMCLGEKLAIANLFLSLVRFIQLTSNYDIVLGTNDGLEPNPYQAETMAPKLFNIIFKSK